MRSSSSCGTAERQPGVGSAACPGRDLRTSPDVVDLERDATAGRSSAATSAQQALVQRREHRSRRPRRSPGRCGRLDPQAHVAARGALQRTTQRRRTRAASQRRGAAARARDAGTGAQRSSARASAARRSPAIAGERLPRGDRGVAPRSSRPGPPSQKPARPARSPRTRRAGRAVATTGSAAPALCSDRRGRPARGTSRRAAQSLGDRQRCSARARRALDLRAARASGATRSTPPFS